MTEHALGEFPAQTGVGDPHAVLQVLRILQRLSAFGQVALDHHPGERLAACRHRSGTHINLPV